MREVEFNRHKLVLYDSIDELPYSRFHAFNKYVTIGAGVGETLSDVDDSLSKILAMSERDDKENLAKQVNNLKQNLYFIWNNVSPTSLAFAVMVKSVNGNEQHDISEFALGNLLESLAAKGISWGMIKSTVDFLKKKVEEDIDLFFPKLSNARKDAESHDMLLKKVRIELNVIAGGPDEREQLKQIDDYFYDLSKPEMFWGPDGVEVQTDKSYEQTCAIISQHVSRDPKQMMTREYMVTLEQLKEQFERNNKN